MAEGREAYEVHLDDAHLGAIQRVGTLHAPAGGRTDLPASFAYDSAWLGSKSAFALDPQLALGRGEQYPARADGFGIFLDSAPDRWGRVLMQRREALAARREERPVRTLGTLDYLLGVNDLTRSGALRFRRDGGPFLADTREAAPPVTSLPELAAIARRIEERGIEDLPEYERWLAAIIAPGSSLGGARPKANFRSRDGTLRIAKFPAKDDTHDVGGWELVVHRLARDAGIDVPDSEALRHSDWHTFCVSRFDREGEGRRMVASAMTLLGYADGEQGASYLEIAQFIASYGSQGRIESDLAQLFRRVLFNVVVGNRDDHLRNHAFLFEPTGWRLSPAYDMNPSLAKAEHALLLDEDSALPAIAPVLATCGYYRLDRAEADSIAREVRDAVARWQAGAKALGLGSDEIRRMAGVIDASRA
ncbi:MAG: type II toxin-antitoxin system HipA family toxin [Lysobacter sp.]|nr:type II toxin-antitoxin system HipA family toxin [Lysobacter sp.]